MKATFLAGRLREAVARDGGADHLEAEVAGVRGPSQERDQAVELVEGPRPAVHHEEGDHAGPLWDAPGLDVDVVDVDAWRVGWKTAMLPSVGALELERIHVNNCVVRCVNIECSTSSAHK